jgi:hypothetical protein
LESPHQGGGPRSGERWSGLRDRASCGRDARRRRPRRGGGAAGGAAAAGRAVSSAPEAGDASGLGSEQGDLILSRRGRNV